MTLTCFRELNTAKTHQQKPTTISPCIFTYASILFECQMNTWKGRFVRPALITTLPISPLPAVVSRQRWPEGSGYTAWWWSPYSLQTGDRPGEQRFEWVCGSDLLSSFKMCPKSKDHFIVTLYIHTHPGPGSGFETSWVFRLIWGRLVSLGFRQQCQPDWKAH